MNKLVSYANLSQELKDLLFEVYPEGISEEDITTVQNAKGASIDCVELKTPEVKYLVKLEVRAKLLEELVDGDIDTISLEELED